MLEIKAPMSGKIIKVSVNVGDKIFEDDEILVLEAMKMEMPISCQEDGIVSELMVKVGQNVDANQILAIIK